MPFFIKAVLVFVRAFITAFISVPQRALDAVRAAHLDHAKHQVVKVIMRPNWGDGVDKAYLLGHVLRAERVVLVDWHYEWEAAHVYAAGAQLPMVIQLVEDTYRVCDVALYDPREAITLA